MNPFMFLPPTTASRLPPWERVTWLLPRESQKASTALTISSSKSSGSSRRLMLPPVDGGQSPAPHQQFDARALPPLRCDRTGQRPAHPPHPCHRSHLRHARLPGSLRLLAPSVAGASHEGTELGGRGKPQPQTKQIWG